MKSTSTSKNTNITSPKTTPSTFDIFVSIHRDATECRFCCLIHIGTIKRHHCHLDGDGCKDFLKGKNEIPPLYTYVKYFVRNLFPPIRTKSFTCIANLILLSHIRPSLSLNLYTSFSSFSVENSIGRVNSSEI